MSLSFSMTLLTWLFDLAFTGLFTKIRCTHLYIYHDVLFYLGTLLLYSRSCFFTKSLRWVSIVLMCFQTAILFTLPFILLWSKHPRLILCHTLSVLYTAYYNWYYPFRHMNYLPIPLTSLYQPILQLLFF